jgi:hypothetical protein
MNQKLKTVFKVLGLALVAGACLLAMLPVKATEFPHTRAFDTQTTALLSAPLITTNKTGSGFFVENAIYHTFHTVNSGTNSIYVGIDRSLDGSNWVAVGTNTVAASGVGETTMTGKWSWVRARWYGTNSTTTVNYLGGR